MVFEFCTAPFSAVTVPAPATQLARPLSRTLAPSFPVEVDSAVVMLGLAHVEAWNGTRGMKSLNSAIVDKREKRALTMIEPNDWKVS